MKTSIDNDRGVVVEHGSNGFYINGESHERASFGGRWVDHFAEIHEGSGGAALTYESFRNTGFNMHFFRSNQDDKTFMVYQLPHGWNSGSVRPHMHCVPMASGTGNVIFEYQYYWSPINSTVGDGAMWASGSVTASFTPDDQYKHRALSFGTIAPSGAVGPSTMLFFAVSRPGATNAGDTYDTTKDHGTGAANLAVLYFDAHVQLMKAGTDNEWY